MKIYFSASIRGGRGLQHLYPAIITSLQEYGTVLTEFIGDGTLTSAGVNKPPDVIFREDVAWLREADVVVAEVSTPSLGVGYELALAETLRKPTLCLWHHTAGAQLSAMIDGNPAFIVQQYHDADEAAAHIEAFFAAVQSSSSATQLFG